MQSAVLRALEFDRVRDALAHATLTPLGHARALALEPSGDPAEVRTRLRLTAAAVRYSRNGGSLALSAPEDLASTLAALDIDDEPLGALQLVGLARLLASVDSVTAALRRSGATGDADGLAGLAARASSFASETAAVTHAIDPAGDVTDRASGALRDIRDSLRRQRAKLRSALESLTRARDTAKYLQDQIVTDRNGRYVVVVRAEHRDAIPGIVHGTSASGASLYLEPLSTVSLNNDVVTLVEREKEEVRRILLALTNAFRQRGDELLATFDVAAEIDELYAKVDLARRTDGVAPDLVDDGRVEFKGARHPLLIPAMRDLTEGTSESHGVVVGSDLTIVPPTRALVISGPNTGGKTVALKAIGLVALMAQAGLLVPVDPGSRFTPFRSVFADIGDEQSISASLSTFSAHIANIVAMDRALERPALVLLDEVGSGTDPAEGGALGAAIVEHFRRRGAVVVATTHDDTLKSYAATTEGVITAGFGFNPDTYAPTYRLIYGAPGRSLAFEIAERLGMPGAVVTDARSRRSGRESQLADHLARVDRELAAVEQERERARAEREAAAAERGRLLEREARLAEREAVLKRRLDDRLNEKLREARAEVDRVVGTLKEKASVLTERADAAPARLSTGQFGALRSDARAALEAIGDAARDPASAPDAQPALTAAPEPGQKVFVVPLGREGVVRTVSGSSIEVDVSGKRLRVKASALRQGGAITATAGPPPRERPREARPSAGGPSKEIVLIGATVDEAIDRAEKFLDAALLADEKRLRVVHGHGTGRLREALTAFFRQHPLVASAQPAPENEGGRAATIVELKD